MNLPDYQIALYIHHNEHKLYYETVSEAIASRTYDSDDFVSDAERDAAIAMNSVWRVQWYPRTPVGFCTVLASSLEAALTAAREEGGE